MDCLFHPTPPRYLHIEGVIYYLFHCVTFIYTSHMQLPINKICYLKEKEKKK